MAKMQGLAHVGVFITEIGKSRKFYEDVLDFETIFEGGITAVSYTHLDVYKRQVYPSASGRHRTVCSEGLREPLHFNRILHIFGKADAECVFVSIVTMYARP